MTTMRTLGLLHNVFNFNDVHYYLNVNGYTIMHHEYSGEATKLWLLPYSQDKRVTCNHLLLCIVAGEGRFSPYNQLVL